MKIKLLLLCLSIALLIGLSCKENDPPTEPPTEIPISQPQLDDTPDPVPQVHVELVSLTANTPVLNPGFLIKDGKNPLSIGHTTSPEVVDWNNDGKKDLLVGTFASGKIKLFLNQGADANPIFDGGEFLQAGGEELHAGSG